MLKFEDLTSERAKKATSRGKARSRQSDNERATSEPSSESESELKKQLRQRKKNRKFRSTPLKLRLNREKGAKKGQVVSQNKNIITGSVFMLMMALN